MIFWDQSSKHQGILCTYNATHGLQVAESQGSASSIYFSTGGWSALGSNYSWCCVVDMTTYCSEESFGTKDRMCTSKMRNPANVLKIGSIQCILFDSENMFIDPASSFRVSLLFAGALPSKLETITISTLVDFGVGVA